MSSRYCYATSFEEGPGADPSQDAFESTPNVDAPACAGCEEPMTALAILHRHDERFPLLNHEALGVYVCTREPGDDFDDWWTKCALGNQVGAPHGATGGLTAVLYDKAPLLNDTGKRAYYTRIADVAEDLGSPELPYGRSKLCGILSIAGYGGDDDFRPECEKCNQEMRFMGQLSPDSHVAYEGSASGFQIFIFMCPKHGDVKLEAFVE
jgi:hypothetical protein